MKLPNNQELNYVIHEHKIGGIRDYQLSIQVDDELQFVNFPQIGMATLRDTPKLTRLFGKQSDDTRSVGWLNFEGITKSSESITDVVEGTTIEDKAEYKIVDKGVLKVGIQTSKFSELFFNGKVLSDRWILRRIPNIFDTAKFGDAKECLLLWKPAEQKKYENSSDKLIPYQTITCDCPVKDASAKFHEYAKEEGTELNAKFTTAISLNSDSQTFEGVSVAEGTWIDLYGNAYIYTPEFITHLYNKQRDRLKEGDPILISTGHDYYGITENIGGSVNKVQLVQEPIKHIVVNGNYTGSLPLTEGDYGLSYEYKLKSTWNPTFQAWVPFDATIYRLSVVRLPACKICWINKVN